MIQKENFRLENFVIKKTSKSSDFILGKGTFATVFLAHRKIDQKPFAIKMVKLNKFDHQTNESLIEKEIKTHQSLNHPNIIRLYNFQQVKNKVFLILEYASNGNLYTYLKKNKLTLMQKKIIFKKICDAVEYIHSKHQIHRDLKPENILLDEELNPKISDFGWSTKIKNNKQRQTFCGTYEYMAPEIFESNEYGYGVDIWSLGVLLYELFHNKSPFKGKSAFIIYKNIQQRKVKFNPVIPQNVKQLISKILKINPKDRPNIKQIKEHNFLKVIDVFDQKNSKPTVVKNLKLLLENNKSINSFGRLKTSVSNSNNSVYTKCNFSNMETFPSTPNQNIKRNKKLSIQKINFKKKPLSKLNLTRIDKSKDFQKRKNNLRTKIKMNLKFKTLKSNNFSQRNTNFKQLSIKKSNVFKGSLSNKPTIKKSLISLKKKKLNPKFSTNVKNKQLFQRLNFQKQQLQKKEIKNEKKLLQKNRYFTTRDFKSSRDFRSRYINVV